MSKPTRDKPWLIRTYAGHSTAAKSNELYRKNLARGQTGLSVAFDLPTQTGYDSDHPLARGEVGKVGVPISHLGDMRTLFDGIPLDRMNTSMTINAPAAWLLALYIATAEAEGVERAKLQGTTQNDIIKEYLSRGTYIFPPEPSLRLTADTIGFTYREVPKWNPMNVCSYHLQEAGATPMQELAFALANAIAVLDAVRTRGQVPESDFPQVVGRISFFVNAGIRFVTEICKMRAFAELWDDIAHTRYGVVDAKQRLFRYGVQVNSLGLTEQQPENNVYRILLEMLAVVMSKNARARSVQLPAWNEALGLPRPWDQQWSLRLQQIVAFETDLLEYADIFDGSIEIAKKVEALKAEALAEMQRIADMGGAVAAIDSAYMKQRLVESNLKRLAAIESGEQTVVGVNAYTGNHGIRAVEGDVTVRASVVAAAGALGDEPLTGLVNCAGVLRDTYLGRVDDAAMDHMFEVNVAGMARVTDVLAPRLADGLALAEDPGESFGEHRSKILAAAMAATRGKPLDERRAEVRLQFEQQGLSLDQPWLNAGSVDCYEFPFPVL